MESFRLEAADGWLLPRIPLIDPPIVPPCVPAIENEPLAKLIVDPPLHALSR